MKKIAVLIAFLFPMILFSQSVAINTDGSLPDNNAILDIKSNSKGILIPRLTTLQRTSIAGPSVGLTVYDIDTYNHWVYRGDVNGGWVELMNNLDKHWERTGTNIFNNNPGNIGIGTNSPAVKLAINGLNPSIGMYNNGLAVGSIQADGFDLKIGTHPDNPVGDILFQPKGVDKFTITESGKIGIGTNSPLSLLSINGNNTDAAEILFQKNNSNKSYLKDLNNHLTLGTSADNTAGDLLFRTKDITRMSISSLGQVNITNTNGWPVGFVLSGADPVLEFKNAGIDRGFVKMIGNDLKIGTELINQNGNFVVTTHGSDKFYVDENGKVGIGAAATSIHPLSIAEQGTGRSGISFLADLNNTERGSLSYTNTSGSLRCNTGDLTVSAFGFGLKCYAGGGFSFGGNTKATGYALSVHGKVIAPEFTTLAIGAWPDYVFADDYKLKPLVEVKKFIADNKHLPNIPSAKEIEKNGIQLGDMSKKLMEKVEELTLYVIELSEQNIQLQKQFNELKKIINNNL